MPGSSSISRTRAGCWSCRQKRVKCDENRPACRRCTKNGLQCNYGIRLIWHDESVAKGVCHGRAGVWSKHGSRAQDERLWLQQQQGKSSHFRSQRKETPSAGRQPDGCEGFWRSSPTSVFLNTTTDDLRLYFDYYHANDDEADALSSEYIRNRLGSNEPTDSVALLPPSLGHGASAFGSVFSYDYALLSHYESVICSSSTLQDDANSNPYRHLILPMAMQCEGLYHAVLAISANILRIADPKYGVAALEHRQRALHNLIALLSQGNWTDQQVDEALGLVLILCWFEITDNCSSSWVTHLDGLWRLLRQRQESRASMAAHSENLSRFFHRYFAFHLVLARTTFHVEDDVRLSKLENAFAISSASLARNQPTGYIESGLDVPQDRPSLSTSPELLLSNMPVESRHVIDPYMGFSNALLLLINEVADLAWQDPFVGGEDIEATAKTLQARVMRLKADLENLQQVSPSSQPVEYHVPPVTERPNSEVSYIAEAYRLGALLLLHEICSPTSPSIVTPRGGSAHLLPQLPVEERQRYVRNILDVIQRSPADVMRTASSPLWPLFLAGCCATDDEERVAVLKIFEKAESRKRFGNIAPAREVVEMVWRQRDLAVQDERKRPKPTTKNAKSKTRSCPNKTNAAEVDDDKRKYPRKASGWKRFEWERAMAMMGGWKLSLT